MSGNGCKTCEGGASFSAAALSLAGFLSIFYLFALLVLIRSKPPRDAVGRAKARKAMKIRIAVVGQFKLLLNFLQVLTSMDKTCNSVPWPLNFRSFLSFLDVINLDVMGLFVGESTLLFVLFLCSCVLVFLCSCVVRVCAHNTTHTHTRLNMPCLSLFIGRNGLCTISTTTGSISFAHGRAHYHCRDVVECLLDNTVLLCQPSSLPQID